MLSRESHNPKSGIGFKLAPRTNPIPCLLFADDNLVLCRAKSTACSNLKQTIDALCTLSGQLVNFHKSSIVFSRQVPTGRRTALASTFNMQPAKALGRYLGIHFSSSSPTRKDLQISLEKNEACISSWHSQYLSKAGRTTLIQSNLEALPTYICSSLLFPKKVCQHIDSLHRNFFWNQSPTKTSTPLIAWNKICTPKSMGGLGLRRTLPLNKAFLAKLAWKILTKPDNL